MSGGHKFVLLGLIAAGFALRVQGLFANTFHADEALFAGWARLIAVWRDPLLATAAIDKPPLLFYLQALFYPLMGTAAGWPARLPGLAASVLIIPLTARLSRQLFRDAGTTLFAAAFIALSPLAIQFSATAFTDPLLTFWLLASLSAIAPSPSPQRGRPAGAWWGGLLFGLAVATKYQALLFLPLVIGVGWLSGRRLAEWLQLLAGFVVVPALLIVWEFARTGSFTLLASQWSSYGGVRLTWSWELAPRLSAWATLTSMLFGSVLLTVLYFLLLPLFLIFLTARGKRAESPFEQLLALFLLAYLAVHWLLAVPVWDRYLLPVAPLIAIVAARLPAWIGSVLNLPHARLGKTAMAALLLMLMIPAARQAARGELPVGGSPFADHGASEVAELLANAPYGTVLYDHWYSWHWRYYFFDRGVYVHWFQHADGLLDDLAVFSGGPETRYLVLPRTDAARPVMRALADAGYSLDMVYRAANMTLFKLWRLPEQP